MIFSFLKSLKTTGEPTSTLRTLRAAETHHINNGDCPKCREIIHRYPGFHAGLAGWFQALQRQFPDAHVAWGGRGRADQERFFHSGTSNAHYGQSAHNYNCAVDIFRLTTGGADWSREWFERVVAPAVHSHNQTPQVPFLISWYGEKGSPYFELPHCEVKNWRTLHFPLVEK